ISLKFTTARGIILLNVPPSEVMSDLRERPLTEAAKAIVRSGDSLLTGAIRRASPKYFGDYLSTLPPIKREPAFAVRSGPLDVPVAAVKTANVRVTDLKNRAIEGLKSSDFEVVESGEQREIISVKRSIAPVNLVLLLDVSGSVENYVNFIRKAARNFVETVDERDRVSIVIFNEDVKKLADFTTDKTTLSKSLDTFDAGGGTAYYDALAYAVADTLRPLKGERSAVVILTDGDDNRSFLAFDSLAGSIQESGALVYPLYVPSGLIAAAATGTAIDPTRLKYMSLSAKSEGEGERLASISGGVYYPITQIGQIQRAYEDIVAQLRSAYLITYRSDAAVNANGVSPRLKIRSKRENTFATVTSVVAGAESRP
ncbi:MAG: VWA domain-containing protein, partial [Pyrinomonadaceae bacterium]|nr:VWA domain-containing protein [Pyrinomonadaceae bacterium]